MCTDVPAPPGRVTRFVARLLRNGSPYGETRDTEKSENTQKASCIRSWKISACAELPLTLSAVGSAHAWT